MIELLVAMTVFGVISLAFYSMLFSATRSTGETKSIAGVSEEARLGFGRMIRDTREGRRITQAEILSSPTGTSSFTVEIDFDASGTIEPYPSLNSQGDYEELKFTFDGTRKVVWLADPAEILMRDVECIDDGGGCKPVFDFSSSRLEYDWNSDGLATWQELDEAPAHGVIGVGNNNDTLDDGELPFISNVTFQLKIVEADSNNEFYAEAQLRNVR
jgi:prepilin-type N-terminal cleavage/methylation domain-containing protein